MATPNKTPESAYREAEAKFAGRLNELWAYLEQHRQEDPTLCIGWALRRAERFLGLDQSMVAERTAVTDRRGRTIVPPISKSFVSAMLSGRSKVSPEVYARLARACEVSTVEFFLAEGWLEPADFAALGAADKELTTPLLQRFADIPEEHRPQVRVALLSVLDAFVKAFSAAERVK